MAASLSRAFAREIKLKIFLEDTYGKSRMRITVSAGLIPPRLREGPIPYQSTTQPRSLPASNRDTSASEWHGSGGRSIFPFPTSSFVCYYHFAGPLAHSAPCDFRLPSIYS